MVKSNRVNECLTLVSTVNGAELDNLARAFTSGVKVTTPHGWTLKQVNAVKTLVKENIFQGY